MDFLKRFCTVFGLAALAAVAANAQTCSAIKVLVPAFPDATINVPYSVGISSVTQGGDPPYSYSAVGLPAGLTMAANGFLSGTPSPQASGTFPVAVTITDSCSPSQTAQFTIPIRVLGQPLVITTSSLPPGIQGMPYRQQVQVTGGDPPYSFALFRSSLSGTGLSLDPNSGIVSGAPTSNGPISFRVQVTDAQQSQAFQAFTLQVDAQLVISTSSTLHFAIMGQPYAFQLTTQAGTGGPNITWSAAANALPAGLTLDPTGLLHGTPTVSGSFTFAVQATDGISPAVLNVTLTVYAPLVITTSSLPNGAIQQAYGPVSLTASGGSGNFTWAASGLPQGITLTGNTIQGTPTVPGLSRPSLTVTDSVSGQVASNSSYSITISGNALAITTAIALGEIPTGGSISTTLAVSGGSGPYKWAPVSLPAGFGITSDGTLSGTPAAPGNLSLTVQVTDSEVPPVTVSKTFALNVLGLIAPSLPVGNTAAAYSQTFTAIGGSQPYSFAAAGLPTGLAMSASGVVGGIAQQTGTFPFTVKVTDGGGIVASGSFSITIIPALAISSTPTLPFGIVGQAYSSSLTIQAGTGGSNVVWSAASNGFPAGLTLDSSGLLHGTPSAAGTFSFTIQASDGISPSVTLNATLTIYGVITITTTSLPKGSYQQTYGPVTLSATGGSGNFNWSATGLPSGVTMSTAGVISGSPAAGGNFSVNVSLTDSVSAQTASQSYSLAVSNGPLSITQPQPAGIALGGSVSMTLAATGGSSPYTWSPVGSLPAGFALTPAGVLTGTPVQPGNLTIGVQVTDSETQAVSATTTVNVNVLGISTASSQLSGLTTATFSQIFTAAGGTAPYSFLASGLPAGLSLSTSGTLSGIVKQSGTYSFSIQVTDSSGIVASFNYSLAITGPGPLSVTAPILANGTVNVLYSASLSTAATGGNPPYQWSIQAGTLPAGITLSATGILSGKPTASGAYSFTVQATDGSGANASASAALQINTAPLTITTQSPLPSGIVGIGYPQQGLAASGGSSPYTFSITPGTQPDGLTQSGLNLTNGVIGGTPTTAGNYSFGITVTDNAGTQAQTTLALNIRPPSADVVLSTGTLSFALPSGSASLPSSQSISIGSSDGIQKLAFTTQVSAGAGWLTASGGATTPTSLTVGLTSLASALPASATPYTATITVTCASTQCSSSDTAQTVTVSLLVTAAPAALNVLTDVLSFSATSSPPGISTQTLTIQNSGGESLGLSSITCDASWCHIGAFPGSLDAGATATITITADPTGLPADYYLSGIDIASSGGLASIPITLLIAQSSQIVLAPAGVQLQMPQGASVGNPNGSFLVTASGAATVNWTATILSAPAWLTLNTPSGTASGSAPGTVSFSINQSAAAGLAAQAWYATIEVSASGVVNSPQDFQVVLNVVPAASPLTPDPQPAGLVFITEPGVAPPPQTVQVFASSATSVGYQASAMANNNGTWLSVSPLTGTTSASAPAQTQVSISAPPQTPGVYYGGVNYSFTTDPTAVRTVTVTLIVKPPVAAPSAVAAYGSVHGNATAPAGCTPSNLAPAPTGLVNNFSAPASWPTPLSILLLDNCGQAVTGGQIVVSFTNGDPPLALGLANGSTGLYSGTWTPRNTGSQVSLSARASATGFAPASIELRGSVIPNVAPVLNKNGTLHAFNPQVGAAMAPGTIVQIYGTALASGIAAASSIPLPTNLNGTSVIIGGVPAPLYFVSPGQINAQIPFELSSNNQYQVIASANGALTTPITIQLAPVTPGFAAFPDGGLIAQNASDNTLITQASPAKPGEYVVAYLAGMGGTSVPVQTGGPSPASPLARASVAPTLTLNGVSAPILFAGLTPGLVGLYQVDFQIPADAPDGTLTVVVSQDTFGSNTTTLPIQH